MIENQNISNDITVEEKDGGGNTVYELSPQDLRATVTMQTTKELELRAGELIQADTCVRCAERAEHWFKLTVHQTADYSFTANTHARVGARLYNRDGELLAADNVDGESNIFLINYPLLQGLVYYLRITPTYNYFTRFSTIITGTFTPVESVSISADTVTLIPNETVTLSATVLPENATMKTLIWSSSDDNIAEVDDFSGVVTAVSQGTTIVFARTLDGSNKRVECEVTVKKSTPGLKTVESCRVRKEMSMNDSAILRDSTGAEVRLQVGDTVSLLSTSKITANDRIWYRILYNGMMTYVPADEGGFDEIDVLSPEEPNSRSVKVNTGDGSPLRLRYVPNTNNESTIIGRFADGATIMVTNETPQNKIWYAVYGETSDGKTSYGWCSGDYLGNYVEFGILDKMDELRVRSGAGYNYTELGKIYKGDRVQILAKECENAEGYPWHKIVYNGSEGYVVAGNNPKNFIFETKWVALSNSDYYVDGFRGDYEDFLEMLGYRESSNDYYAKSESGTYLGMYQMGPLALKDAGFKDSNGNWTSLAESYDVTSDDTFLASSSAQERAVREYHKKNWGYLKYYGYEDILGVNYYGVVVTESGLLAAAHLVGASGVVSAVKNNTDIKDSLDTPAYEYMDLLANYDISEIK